MLYDSFTSKEGSSNISPTPSLTVNVITKSPKPTSTPPVATPTKRPTNLVFEDNIKVDMTKDDFVKDEDIKDEVIGGSTVVTDNSFSNGIAVKSTEAALVISQKNGLVTLTGSTGAKITIEEMDSSKWTTESLREFYLGEVYQFNDYISHGGYGIPVGVEISDSGELTNFDKYYTSEVEEDYSRILGKRITADTNITTAYGIASYIEIHRDTPGSYIAYAFIQCPDDRIIQIRVEEAIRDNLYGYVMEMTNNSILMIE